MRSRFIGLLLLSVPFISQAEETAPRSLKSFFDDGRYLLTSPKHLNEDNKNIPLLCTGVILGTALFDKPIRDHLLGYKNSDPSEDLRKLGDKGQLAGPVIGTVFALHGWGTNNERSKETGYLAYESFLWSGAVTSILKLAVGRERPFKTDTPFDLNFFGRDSSFPSGHTTAAFSAATVFYEQYPHWYVFVPAYGAATAVGFSRLYANQHWLSDVIAGAAIGTSVSHILRKRHRHYRESKWEWRADLNGIFLEHRFD